MRGRLLLNLGLALLVGALMLVVWLRPGQEPPPAPDPLTALTAGAIERIEITPPHGEPFVLEKRAGAWFLTTPAQVPARQHRVDSLLGLATTPRRAALAEGTPQADFGLGPPRGRVRFDDVEIAFGDSNPVEFRRYVATGGATYLIDDGYFHHLSSSWAEWVDLRLLPAGATLERAELPAYTLERDAEGGYSLRPEDSAPSADALARRAQDWTLVQAIQAHAGRTPPGDAPELALSYRAEGEDAPITLRFALERQAGAVLLHRRDLPLAYELPLQEAERLLRAPLPDRPADADGAGPVVEPSQDQDPAPGDPPD